jgi:diguanylate cyclase (GGDEF)-like protein
MGRILLVDEDTGVVSVVREYLQRAGFQVNTVANGWEALRVLKESEADIIISELSISDMDGCSLREKCLINPAMRDIPFLFMVPQQQTDNQLRALRAGVDDLITKPFDPIVLVARVQAVLQRRRTYEEMVRIDPLTRLLNRPALEKQLQEELDRIIRYERHATLVLIDIDKFQRVNEESGLAMGDLLLTCLAGVILTTIRSVDIAGRYRGEQFLLCLPETPIAGATILARRMQQQMAAIVDAVAAIPLTFTCALLHAPEHGQNLRQVMARIEAALEQAKAQGPGTLHVWSPDTSA